MKKIKFYKHMCNYDESRGGYYAGQGRYRFGYHFEQSNGYLFECPHGVSVALEKVSGGWNATEITSGNSVSSFCNTRTEAIEKACIVSPAVRKALDSKNEYITANINALKAYAEQQQKTIL